MTGFVPNHPTADHAAWLQQVLRGARAMAEPLDGPAVERLAALSSETRVYIAAGLLEDAGHLLYNTHVLVGQEAARLLAQDAHSAVRDAGA